MKNRKLSCIKYKIDRLELNPIWIARKPYDLNRIFSSFKLEIRTENIMRILQAAPENEEFRSKQKNRI